MSSGTRRLAAIMFTDMAGYTALTQSDEAQAMEVLERHNRLLRPFFPRFQGREVKTLGDSFLVEFDSALNAVKCAQEIQSYLHDYNLSEKDGRKIMLRIGVHLGDVIHEGNDVFGDAVNIASRLQPLAPVEGVAVSDQVYGQVSNKMPQTFIKLPPQELKNVSTPVGVYRMVMPWDGAGSQGESLDPRRVAVLPFANMSPDPNDEFFADGLTEELIDRLAQVKGLQVIARTSVMSYKRKELKAGEIGRELRAGTLVEGSVRKAGIRIRVTAQLIDAGTEAHLWSSRYDRDLQDVFAVQTDIAEQVAGALRVQLVQSEKEAIERRPTENMEAYTLYLRGRSLWNRRRTNDVKDALTLFQRAVQKDPGYAKAYSGIADCYSILVDRHGIPQSEAAPKAHQAAEAALRLDPNLPEAHASMGLVLLHETQVDEALREFEKAVELNPGYASAYQWYSIALVLQGKMDEGATAIAMAEKGDPMSPIILYNSGFAAWFLGRDSEALEKWGRALEINPELEVVRWGLAGLYIQEGRIDEAREELKRAEAYPVEDKMHGTLKDSFLAFLYGRIGDRDRAEAHLRAVLAAPADTPELPSAIAFAYAGVGDLDKYFEYMMKSIDDMSSFVVLARAHPLLADARADPRFKEYLAARERAGHS